jgi:hypothetical protein
VDTWTAKRWAHNRGEAAALDDRPDPAAPEALADVRRARTIARWLDDRYLDPLIGFVLPGVGDLVGSIFGMYIVSIAARRRMPAIVIARMLLNLAIDAAFGVVPVIGDVGDLAFQANRKNVALLESRATGQSTWKDWAAVVGALVLFLALFALLIYASVRLIQWVF